MSLKLHSMSTTKHELDSLTRRHTAFQTFQELLDTPEYVPTLTRPAQQELADAYDSAQAERGDLRRAWRGSRHTCAT